MSEEVISEGDSLFIFTQLTEIGKALQSYLKKYFYDNYYYLHGGTVRQKRERMITEFQDSETEPTEPSVFILS
ncbi:MAG: hypothetical protein WBA93_26090 [Microcoleaceae cyanobacterium]